VRLSAGLVETTEDSKHICTSLKKEEVKNGDTAEHISLRSPGVDVHANLSYVLRVAHHFGI
jgi:hypothetical protein